MISTNYKHLLKPDEELIKWLPADGDLVRGINSRIVYKLERICLEKIGDTGVILLTPTSHNGVKAPHDYQFENLKVTLDELRRNFVRIKDVNERIKKQEEQIMKITHVVSSQYETRSYFCESEQEAITKAEKLCRETKHPYMVFGLQKTVSISEPPVVWTNHLDKRKKAS